MVLAWIANTVATMLLCKLLHVPQKGVEKCKDLLALVEQVTMEIKVGHCTHTMHKHTQLHCFKVSIHRRLRRQRDLLKNRLKENLWS